MPGILIIFVATVVILLAWIHSLHNERLAARKNALCEIAGRSGFTFQERDASFIRIIRKSRYFSESIPVRVENCLSRKNGEIEVKVADCFFRGSDTPARMTICAVIDYDMNLPLFFMRREDKIADQFGRFFDMQDVNFEDDPSFSESFVLQGGDEVTLKYLFNTEIRQFMMRYASSAAKIEGSGHTLILYRGKGEWPVDFEILADEALELCRLLKGVVKKEGLQPDAGLPS